MKTETGATPIRIFENERVFHTGNAGLQTGSSCRPESRRSQSRVPGATPIRVLENERVLGRSIPRLQSNLRAYG